MAEYILDRLGWRSLLKVEHLNGDHIGENARCHLTLDSVPKKHVEKRTVDPCCRVVIVDPLLIGAAVHMESLGDEQERAIRDVSKAADDIAKGAPALQVSTQVLEGSPKKMIVEEAEHWQADLVVVASHGHGPTERFLLGSTAHEVAVHSPCSVEIVRSRRHVGA